MLTKSNNPRLEQHNTQQHSGLNRLEPVRLAKWKIRLPPYGCSRIGLTRLVQPIRLAKWEIRVNCPWFNYRFKSVQIVRTDANRFDSSGSTDSVGKMENRGLLSLVQLSVQNRSEWKITAPSTLGLFTNRFDSSGSTDSVGKMENQGLLPLVQQTVQIGQNRSNRFGLIRGQPYYESYTARHGRLQRWRIFMGKYRNAHSAVLNPSPHSCSSHPGTKSATKCRSNIYRLVIYMNIEYYFWFIWQQCTNL